MQKSGGPNGSCALVQVADQRDCESADHMPLPSLFVMTQEWEVVRVTKLDLDLIQDSPPRTTRA